MDYSKKPSLKKGYSGEDVQKFFEIQKIKPTRKERNKKGYWEYFYEAQEKAEDDPPNNPPDDPPDNSNDNGGTNE